VRSYSWVRQSLRRWCSALSASHSRRIAVSVSWRAWWAWDSTRGRGTGAAFGSAPDRSRRPKITFVSSRVGGGLELDAPPASTSIAAAGAAAASSAAADGVLDDIAVIEVVAAVGAVGTPSAAAASLGVGAATARPTSGAWGPDGAVSVVAAGGGGGTTLGAEGEEALTSKGWVKTCRHVK
jgi:hypothetical protein